MSITPVQGATRPNRTGQAADSPGWCARPACRNEFRRTVGVTGRPSEYCSRKCQRLVHAEKRAATARVKRLEEMLRQARTDLDAFIAHDLEASLGSTAQQRVDVAVGKGATAVKYLSADSPGVAELTELVAAVNALITRTSTADVA